MDIASHALVGVLCAILAGIRAWKARLAIGLVAASPDLPVGIVYLLLGREIGRPFWIPRHEDWVGVREAHPVWSAMWEIPHSLLFLALIVTPIILRWKLPRVAIVAYLSHILLDIPTHTGEWAMRPLYPISWKIAGWTDAWAWTPGQWALSSLAIGALVALVLVLRGEWRWWRVAR